MKNIVIVIAVLALSASCASTSSTGMKTHSIEIIDYCLREVERLTGEPLSSEANQAYLFASEKGLWVNFTHGAAGTFGERSLDYSLILSCAVLKGPPIKMVFMSEPLKDPIIEEPERNYFDSPEGATEILFKRESGKFKYCCSQPFKEKNIEKHNPDFPWNKNQVGS